MVLFAAFMMWAYTWTEYVVPGRKTSVWRPLWDSINYSEVLSHAQGLDLSKWPTADFAVEIIGSLKYYFDASRGKPGTRATQSRIYPSTIAGQGKVHGGPWEEDGFWNRVWGIPAPRRDRQTIGD
jgi:hypothetical protein